MAEGALTETPFKALGVTLAIAFTCALLVSVTAVSLRPRYLDNLEAERMARLNSVLQALQAVSDVAAENIEARVVELDSGLYSDNLDPASYDARRSANDPNQSFAIPPEFDIAGIKRRAEHAVVYLLRKNNGALDVVILPVRGVGYQSALYAFLALADDGNEILSLKFYEQGETPGLGSQIQSPDWESLWTGKRVYDQSGRVSIRVGKRGAGGDRIDAISGATRTSLGVDHMIQFWLGDYGFGPYLKRLRDGEG